MTERDIFLAALEQPEAARAAFLDQACGGDSDLRGRVESLLSSHDGAGSFLGTPLVSPPEPEYAATRTYTPEAKTIIAPERSDDSEEAMAFLAPPGRADSLGRIGHYEVLQVLGRGGFGIVFRAFDDILQRVVAVKVMTPQLAATSPARKRFLREAQSSAKVRHENVVQVYEVKEQPLPYLAMEFIPGETLQERLNRTGPLETSETVRIGRQIAEGLAAAHVTDLIHRDIKPGNILLEGGQNRVKITDFGLARAADDASISQSGIIAGTPMYMAPEQALGHKLDQRADLFSLGSVLYQMVTGRPPFRANGALAVLKRVAEDTPRPIREIVPETPQWMCDIIAKLHAKKPDERYQSARELADVLADCEAQLKDNAKLKDFSRIPAAKPTTRRVQYGKWVATSGLIVMSVTGLVAIVAGLFYRSPEPKRNDDSTPTVQHSPNADDSGVWVPLFNGKDLTGWKTHPAQPGTWEVNGGVLVGSTRQSHLFSERGDFANFHLRAEVKINTGGDGGIRFRTPFKLLYGPKSWQIIPAGGYEAEFTKFVNASAQTGSVWRVNQDGPPNSLFRSVDPSFPRPDEWCLYEVIADGNRFTTKLDGKVIANCTDPDNTYSKGHIALQCFSPQTMVQFRKIEVKELPPSPPPLAVAPFDAAKAKEHQDAWAKYLGVPVECKDAFGHTFRLIPPGEFEMGSSEKEIEKLIAEQLTDEKQWGWLIPRLRSEAPLKKVRIVSAFYEAIHETTVRQFRAFVKATGYKTRAELDGGGFLNDARSPECVWNGPKFATNEDAPAQFLVRDDATAYCRWLSRETGREYAIPSEQQWEFACRAGTTSSWSHGNDQDELRRFGWTAWSGRKEPNTVGLLVPNAFGLYDVHGNVSEVALNSAGEPYHRGGSFGEGPVFARSTMRTLIDDSLPYRTTGFRIIEKSMKGGWNGPVKK